MIKLLCPKCMWQYFNEVEAKVYIVNIIDLIRRLNHVNNPVVWIGKKKNAANEVLIKKTISCLFSKYTQNKKETSVFHGPLSFDPVKMSEQKLNKNGLILYGRIIEPNTVKIAFSIINRNVVVKM